MKYTQNRTFRFVGAGGWVLGAVGLALSIGTPSQAEVRVVGNKRARPAASAPRGLVHGNLGVTDGPHLGRGGRRDPFAMTPSMLRANPVPGAGPMPAFELRGVGSGPDGEGVAVLEIKDRTYILRTGETTSVPAGSDFVTLELKRQPSGKLSVRAVGLAGPQAVLLQ